MLKSFWISPTRQPNQKQMKIDVRLYQERDTPVLARIFFDAVRNGTIEFYSIEQREAWAPQVPDIEDFGARLKEVNTFVAEKADVVAGFMTLDSAGYIDLAFVRSDFIRKGVGSILYEHVLDRAVHLGLPLLHTQASEMAKPFFEKNGWTLLETQKIIRGDIELTNHKMEKHLD